MVVGVVNRHSPKVSSSNDSIALFRTSCTMEQSESTYRNPPPPQRVVDNTLPREYSLTMWSIPFAETLQDVKDALSRRPLRPLID